MYLLQDLERCCPHVPPVEVYWVHRNDRTAEEVGHPVIGSVTWGAVGPAYRVAVRQETEAVPGAELGWVSLIRPRWLHWGEGKGWSILFGSSSAYLLNHPCSKLVTDQGIGILSQDFPEDERKGAFWSLPGTQGWEGLCNRSCWGSLGRMMRKLLRWNGWRAVT